MSPLFASTQKSRYFLLTWKLFKKATFTPDPNINTGSEIIIRDADSTSHQTVPKIKFVYFTPRRCVYLITCNTFNLERV